jgi:hypothetical protein
MINLKRDKFIVALQFGGFCPQSVDSIAFTLWEAAHNVRSTCGGVAHSMAARKKRERKAQSSIISFKGSLNDFISH